MPCSSFLSAQRGAAAESGLARAVWTVPTWVLWMATRGRSRQVSWLLSKHVAVHTQMWRHHRQAAGEVGPDHAEAPPAARRGSPEQVVVQVGSEVQGPSPPPAPGSCRDVCSGTTTRAQRSRPEGSLSGTAVFLCGSAGKHSAPVQLLPASAHVPRRWRLPGPSAHGDLRPPWVQPFYRAVVSGACSRAGLVSPRLRRTARGSRGHHDHQPRAGL